MVYYFFRGLITVTILAIAIIGCNFFQCLSLILLPISPKAVDRFNRFFAKFWYGLLCFCDEHILQIKITQTGDPLPQGENAIFISNHQSMSDVPVLLYVANQLKCTQSIKWFVKDILKWTPGVGWGLLVMGNIFLKRDWSADKAKIASTFSRLRSNGNHFWVISFLEGTRATPKKLQASQAYAKKNNLPMLKNLLIPRVKGFEATVNGLDGAFTAIYDATIIYPNLKAPTLLSFFFTKQNPISIHIQRIPRSDLPNDPESRQLWLMNRFLLKDQVLENHKKGLL